MKLALTVNGWVDEDLMFAQQFGADAVVAEAVLPDDGRHWDAGTLSALRNRVEKAGLTLAGLDRLPIPIDRTIQGETGRDDEIETVCRFVEDAGGAGIPILGYAWTLFGDNHPERRPEGRGGVLIASSTHQTPQGSTEARDRLVYFLEGIMPTAEKSSVRMAYCTGDVFESSSEHVTLHTVEVLQRLLEAVPSPCNGLDFCPAAFVGSPDGDAVDAAHMFGANAKIFMVTIRNLRRQPPTLIEAFPDEGEIHMPATLHACLAAGFDGPVRPGVQPIMADDTAWGHRAQAFTAGYLRALLQGIG